MNRGRWPARVSLAGLALASGLLLFLVAGPLYTDDLWWHVAAGETYLAEGPWPAADPLLHTAHSDAPVQHEWLFSVAVHAVDRALGPTGLRLLHVAWVAGILGLAGSLFARAGRWPVAGWSASSAFLVLAWWRLAQLRPDLASIAAALLLYGVLLEQTGPPSRRRVAAAVGLLFVWANLHSLFAVGLALIVAALCAEALRAGLARGAEFIAGPDAAPLPPDVDWIRVRRLAAALGLGSLATLLNPRGIEQHLTFFRSSADSAIWQIRDEWIPFSPLDWSGAGFAGNPLTWLLVDALALAFLAAAGLRMLRYLRRPRTDTLDALDARHLGLGLASLVAIAVSVRFFWMGAFLLIYLLHQARRTQLADAGRAPAWTLAAASLLAALALPVVGGYRGLVTLLPDSPAEYLTRPYVTAKYYSEGVRFLRDTDLRGNLFNHYWMGGFLGYWLSPGLRTYVDGRVEHYPPEILEEVRSVTRRRGLRPREGPDDLLARRQVDLFFGVGVPPRGSGLHAGVYSAANLEGDSRWILVSRAVDHAIWLRADLRNRQNLLRVEAYYAREGVPFDVLRGLDPAAVIRTRPDWAALHRMLPRDAAELLADVRGPDPTRRFTALWQLGAAHVLLGSYNEGLALLEQASGLRPRARAALRARIYGELRLNRARRATALATALVELAPPEDDRAREIADLVGRVLAVPKGRGQTRAQLIDQFPLLNAAEEERLLRLYRSPLVAGPGERRGVARAAASRSE